MDIFFLLQMTSKDQIHISVAKRPIKRIPLYPALLHAVSKAYNKNTRLSQSSALCDIAHYDNEHRHLFCTSVYCGWHKNVGGTSKLPLYK